MATIVSCFLANSNNRQDRKTEKYLDYGEKLLNINVPKIIFMDESVIKYMSTKIKEENKVNTVLIPFNHNDIYLYQHINNITNFNILSTFHEKDTLDYMLLICNKTEIIKRAVELNPYKTKQFVWIDFGINHIFKNKINDKHFINEITQLTLRSYNNVRIGSILNPQLTLPADIYNQVAWYFAGGVFGGNSEKLLEFAELTKQKCLETIYERGTIMWEVNIWYLVFMENKELFDLYNCDHNEMLITRY